MLEKKHKRKLSDEEKATDISPEDSQIDEAMENTIAQFEEADLLNEQLTTEKKQKEEAEVEKGCGNASLLNGNNVQRNEKEKWRMGHLLKRKRGLVGRIFIYLFI